MASIQSPTKGTGPRYGLAVIAGFSALFHSLLTLAIVFGMVRFLARQDLPQYGAFPGLSGPALLGLLGLMGAVGVAATLATTRDALRGAARQRITLALSAAFFGLVLLLMTLTVVFSLVGFLSIGLLFLLIAFGNLFVAGFLYEGRRGPV